MDVEAALGACGLLEAGEGLHGTGQVDLEAVPVGQLVAAGGLPFGKLVLRQAVEFHPVGDQLRHSVGPSRRHFGEVLGLGDLAGELDTVLHVARQALEPFEVD